MTHKEIIKRNIELTFDFVDSLIDKKNEVENLPDKFSLEFIEKDFPKSKCKQLTTQGLEKKYVHVENSL
jgi:hypothetical protein